MRLLCILLSACVIFAALKLAIIALFVLFGVSLLWGFYLRPVEVAGFLAYCATLSVIGAHPALSLSIIALAVILSQIGKKPS
ncbi:hypothetical protein [Sphingopyxis sp.]|jgi:hypothetical protein|uniref:hypothetical protein n=1 Tax=Sphingopyxis sp. TaxID=1908224 RepID=UPI00311DE86A